MFYRVVIRVLSFFIILVLSDEAVMAQKPAIDSSVYAQWEKVENASISNDGKYASYVITKGTYTNSSRMIVKMVVTSSTKNWERSYEGIESRSFTPDSKQLVFLTRGDSLAIVGMGTDVTTYLPGVNAFRIVDGETHDWLVYSKNGEGQNLVVRNLATGREQSFINAGTYQFNDQANVLVVVIKNSNGKEQVQWNEPDKGVLTTIFEGGTTGKIIFDRSGDQLAFEADKGNGEKGKASWYFRRGMEKAREVGEEAKSFEPTLFLDGINRFSYDGSRLFLTLKENIPAAAEDAVKVDVWNYMDEATQEMQRNNAGPKSYLFSLNLVDNKMTRIEQAGDGYLNISDKGKDDWGVMDRSKLVPGGLHERSSMLVNSKDGSRVPIPGNSTVSPSSRYAVYFDQGLKHFFSYDIQAGTFKNISKPINTKWIIWEPNAGGYPRGLIAGWVDNDEGVLVYDAYDIWWLDLRDEKAPVNLTNGYGARTQTLFFLRDEHYANTTISSNEKLILTAFNTRTKQNGFYSIQLGRHGDPEQLTMGNYAYSISRNPYVDNDAHFEPVKARDAEAYIVQRQSATESPNLFYTTDFKHYEPVTDLHPEKAYNWYTTELHEWKSPDGVVLQGVLYKPENFDASKKYPVIFYYYTKRSDNLNVYQEPEPADGRLNIPWYVSNGYLVFTPDIHYEKGEAYQSCYNSIVSAARYLGKLPFVNSKKMAIQGISWGGYQTNYLVTHTQLFAAACSASGVADFISSYNGYTHGGMISQDSYEGGAHGPGGTLWDNKKWFIKNSPVMNADQVTTPFLMFHTSVDGACPFPNAMELYLALRRLGKKVWLLEYNDGNHGVWGKSAMDFDVRLQQFFDHYLKDKPAPIWMTRGVPAKLKGVETGLGYENEPVKPL